MGRAASVAADGGRSANINVTCGFPRVSRDIPYIISNTRKRPAAIGCVSRPERLARPHARDRLHVLPPSYRPGAVRRGCDLSGGSDVPRAWANARIEGWQWDAYSR